MLHCLTAGFQSEVQGGVFSPCGPLARCEMGCVLFERCLQRTLAVLVGRDFHLHSSPTSQQDCLLHEVRVAVASYVLKTPKDGDCQIHVTCPRATPPS